MKAIGAMVRHETWKIHLDSCPTYHQWRLHETLDEEQENEDYIYSLHEQELKIEKEKSFWRQVLSRLLDVILTLSTCNLVFRGHRKKADSIDTSSRGNVLSIVELLAKYDFTRTVKETKGPETILKSKNTK